MFRSLNMTTQPFDLRVTFPGCPSEFDVPWNRETLSTLRDMGFNTIQLNIAWGSRPDDEPLNLEDVVRTEGLDLPPIASLPLRSGPDGPAVARRRARLTERIALCRSLGLRSVFHFGAPYNMHARFGDTPPRCLSDEAVVRYYETLIEAFHEQYPGVDDALLYTYDQDAWLCSEFGDCARCAGVPLHRRVSAFVNRLAQTWRRGRPQGRLWWEPWELSAGQVLASVERLDASCVGLALHANIAEVMATLPVDRWLRNTVAMSREAGLPVIVEYFLGAPTEEVEPYVALSWPLVTWRGLQAIAALDVAGVKEYYGSIPTRPDANLAMTALFFARPDQTEDEALRRLAEPFGDQAQNVMAFWRLTSAAMERFPWETSWYIRKIGRCDPQHGMEAAFLRGQQAHTPSWESTRRAIFMKTDNAGPDAWLLEDVQIRCDLAARLLSEALPLGEQVAQAAPEPYAAAMQVQVAEIAGWRRRALSYVYHIRETNLTALIRRRLSDGRAAPAVVMRELRETLEMDVRNGHLAAAAALDCLDKDVSDFVRRYFVEAEKDRVSKGGNSLTTR
jgi:sugar phosphate isomerase/epimerase